MQAAWLALASEQDWLTAKRPRLPNMKTSDDLSATGDVVKRVRGLASRAAAVKRGQSQSVRLATCLERAHYSRIDFTEWPYQNQTLTRFHG